MPKVLELENISMSYCDEDKALEVLDNINLSLEEGEIVAIVGPSGSGKTTILNIIAKLIENTSGTVKMNGEIGYMFQRDHLLEYRTIYNNIILGLEIKKRLTKENEEKVKEMLETYQLWDFRNNYPSELSGGMRQRVALIRTLAISPSLLLLDEPFASLDYQTKLIVCEDIYRIIKKENKATIIVTHDLSEAISIADRIVVLTERPASIKKTYEIKFPDLKERTPLLTRKSIYFKEYFDKIWGDLYKE